jgi:uncharacterized delta-60 repeat protein
VATVSAYGNGFWDAVAVQPDGKIVVGGLGTVARNMGTGYVVARYNPNGTLDTAFGDPAKNGRTGVWTYDPSSKDERLQALGVVTDSSNRVTGIMVEGRGFDPSGQSAFAAIKLTPAGALDPAYGTNGTALLTFGGRPSTPYGMAVTPNGGVVLVGDPGQPAGGIAVLTPAGQLDTSFNGTGYRTDTAAGVTAPYTAYQDVAVQPVGTGYRYVVVGDAHYGTYNRGIVTAYTSAGQVDTTFATNGLYVTPDTGGFSGGAPTADGNLMHVAVAPDGSIVVAGYVSIINPDGSTWSEGVVTHLLADGTVDTAFGPTGEGLATFTNGPDIRALAVDASGRPVFGGENSSRQGWLVRLTAA